MKWVGFDPAMRGDNPITLEDALNRLMGTLRAPPTDVVNTVFSCWAEIVGSDLSPHCRPVSIKAETLLIEAENSTWASELSWLQKDLISRVIQVTGSNRISKVQIRVSRHK